MAVPTCPSTSYSSEPAVSLCTTSRPHSILPSWLGRYVSTHSPFSYGSSFSCAGDTLKQPLALLPLLPPGPRLLVRRALLLLLAVLLAELGALPVGGFMRKLNTARTSRGLLIGMTRSAERPKAADSGGSSNRPPSMASM